MNKIFQSTSRKTSVLTALMGVSVSVPLDVGQSPWKSVVFGTKAATEYKYKEGASTTSSVEDVLQVLSKSSSGAQVYYFNEPKRLIEVHAQGRVKKTAPMNKEVDDAYLRWGVVYAGERRLNWLERRFASDWIVDLDAIAKKIGNGFGFLDLGVYKGMACEPGTKLQERSDYVFERCAGMPGEKNKFEIRHTLSKEYPVLGLWLSSDADDSVGEFELYLTHLGYTEAAH